MCGIAGFSLNDNSTINARALSHHLLAEIESRGGMASGYAFMKSNGNLGVYKSDVTGSNLKLSDMPRNAKTVILHTRLATQGSPQKNENNHPVMSPDSTIALTHNGVIWNDSTLKRTVLSEYSLPEVDTAVIPALVQKNGVSGLSQVMGDAAVAWLVEGQVDTLHLARIESSPAVFTHTRDGSFVYASTRMLLVKALNRMGLEFGEIFDMNELDYYQVRGGMIDSWNKLRAPEGFGMGYASMYRGMTSGQTTSLGARFRTESYEDVWSEWTEEDYEWAEANRQGAIVATPVRREVTGSMALYGGNPNDKFRPEPEYYTVDIDGDTQFYDTLDELENQLLQAAANTSPDMHVMGEGPTEWTNHFIDIGSFGFRDDELISWVKHPEEILIHEDPRGDGLGYIKEGIGLIKAQLG